MKKQIAALVIVTSLFFTACQNPPPTDNSGNPTNEGTPPRTEVKLADIPFSIAKNYFVKNSVASLDNPKIETVEKFDEIFGMATTMGEDGKPTEIDFAKQYVIAVVLPETDSLKTVVPVSLQKDEQGQITLSYKIEVGQKRTFTIVPNFAIIVSKADSGNVVLKAQK